MSADLRPLELRGLSVELAVRSRRHYQDLIHELKMLGVAADSGVVEVAPRLAELIEQSLAPHVGARDALWDAAEAAAARGDDEFDVDLELPETAISDVEQGLRLLEEADRLCRDYQLLQVAAPPEVAAYRRWVTEELRRQVVDRQPPRRFPSEVAGG